MSKNIDREFKGKTVDEAIFVGLEELGLGIDQVSIEILNEGSKGFLGIGKSAVVRMTAKEAKKESAEDFLNRLFLLMGVSATASAAEAEDKILIDITGDTTGMLIGRRGETLDALQYLTSLVVNRKAENYKRVVIDTENYREKREQTLVKLAGRIASKVSKTGKRVVLEPMNPYERRILHATLQDRSDIETISEGEEPYRRVIIKKKKR
jgi:spoIIIJ-associated protein